MAESKVKTLEFKVGLLTIAAVILFIWFIIYVSQNNPLHKRYRLEVTFSDVELLQEGDRVRLNGISIGKVEKIGMRDDKCLVTLSIDSRYKIRKDAHIVVGSVGLFGTNYIKISQYFSTENAEYWQPGDVIVGEEEAGLTEIITDAQELLRELKGTTRSLNLIVGDEELRNDFKKIFKNLRKASESTHRMLEELHRRMERISTHVEKLTESLENEFEQTADKVRGTLDDIKEMTSQLKCIAMENRRNMRKAIGKLAELTESLTPEGSFGKKMDSTLENAKEISRRLRKLMEELDDQGGTAADIREIARKLKETAENVQALTTKAREFVESPELENEIRRTFDDAHVIADRIDEVGSSLQSMELELQTRIMYASSRSDYWSDFLASISGGSGWLLRFGFEDIDDSDGFNTLQVGKSFGGGRWTVRTGIFSDKLGLGIDSRMFRDRFMLTVEALDPDRFTRRLSGVLELGGRYHVKITNEKVESSPSVTYVGIGRTF